VTDTLALPQLPLGCPDITKKFKLIHEGVVLSNIEENRGTPPVHCEDDRAFRSFHLLDDGSGVGSEL
jgi:hypothetical protein